MRLTTTQRWMLHELKNLPDSSRYSWGCSRWNRTGCTLERHSLVAYEYDHTKTFPWGRWSLTERRPRRWLCLPREDGMNDTLRRARDAVIEQATEACSGGGPHHEGLAQAVIDYLAICGDDEVAQDIAENTGFIPAGHASLTRDA